MSALRNPQIKSRGFTLMEIIIAMLLLSILGIVGARLFKASVYTNETISQKSMAYASARYASERMSREIREMSHNGSLQISSALNQSKTLSFTKTGPQGQQIVTFTFNVDGTLSMAYDNGTPHTLATHLSSGDFSYYTDLGADAGHSHSTIDPTSLHYVFIRLQIKPDPDLNQVLTLSQLIYLHNT